MILSQDDVAQFLRLMWGLQFYVNQQHHLLPDIKSREAYAGLTGTEKKIVRDALWKNPDLIDVYTKKNPDGFSSEELSIIRKWKGFVAGTFHVFRYLKDYTVFIGGSKVYGVLGLYDRLEDVFYGRPLPIMVEAILLPYKGRIVYDGLLQSYNIYFGAGIRSGLKEEYLTAKQNGQIITTLEPETATTKPLQQQRKLDKDSEAAITEIVTASERVRGGTVIQSATFGLLRASAKVVQSAVQNPDDLEEVWRLERQVRKALNRLQKVLERSEQ